jgi:hypothetical protein
MFVVGSATLHYPPTNISRDAWRLDFIAKRSQDSKGV